uniref:AlNc14C180G8200 protein n=1 Tax=Albugo laibachii Nc14 TaxID=890382 RepID=F0WP52_9STRA|nr:AlNc14C180G8200 [Albugo laibachii Nc14]|eukprot:CCA23096.1 AlNc14C180G8200 [Albugo laibachii Nc14]
MGCGAKVCVAASCWRVCMLVFNADVVFMFKIYACVHYQNDRLCFHVTIVKLEHNHEVSKRTYDVNLITRAAWSEEMVDAINLLRQHVHCEPDCQAQEGREGIENPVESLQEWMREFCEEKLGHVGRLFPDVIDLKVCFRDLHCTSYQVHAFKDCEVPRGFKDRCNARTNASRYEVFSLMAHELFGKRQYFQQAILQNECRRYNSDCHRAFQDRKSCLEARPVRDNGKGLH